MCGFDSCFPCYLNKLIVNTKFKKKFKKNSSIKPKKKNNLKLSIDYYKKINRTTVKDSKKYFTSSTVEENILPLVDFKTKKNYFYQFINNRPRVKLLLILIENLFFFSKKNKTLNLFFHSFFFKKIIFIFDKKFCDFYINIVKFDYLIANLIIYYSINSVKFLKNFNFYFAKLINDNELKINFLGKFGVFKKQSKRLMNFPKFQILNNSSNLFLNKISDSSLSSKSFFLKKRNFFLNNIKSGFKLFLTKKLKFSFWLRFHWLKALNDNNRIYKHTIKGVYSNNFFFNKNIEHFYLSYAKLFFYNFDISARLLTKHEANVFNIQDYDHFNEQVIRLTRNSENFNKSEYFSLSSVFFNKIERISNFYNFSTLLILNNFLLNDELYHSNYCFYSVSFDKFFYNNYYKNYKNFIHIFESKNKDILPFEFFQKLFKIKFLSLSPFSKLAKKSVYFFSHSLRNLNKKNNISKSVNFDILSLFHNFSRIELFTFLQARPFFFKYIILKKKLNSIQNLNFLCFFDFFNNFLNINIDKYFFYKKFNHSNVVPSLSFSYSFKKFVIRSFKYHKFSFSSTPWHYATLIRFLEYCSGKKIYINFSTFLNSILDYQEILRCELWAQRLKSFRKALGPKLFLNESLQIIYISLKLKDPYFLSNWLLGFFYKISFWKYKLVFRYLQYVLRYFFWPIFSEVNLKGLKFQLKGKVSVAGNSRTRTVVNKIGYLSHSTFNNKVLYNLNLIRTFTGVIGFKTWLVF